MTILSNGCKPDNFKPYSSQKLSFTSYVLESCVKLSFRELCGSKLSGLYPFDNVAIINWVKSRLKTERETVSLWDTNPWSDFVTLIENALRTHHWELITMRVTLLKKISSEFLSLLCKPFLRYFGAHFELYFSMFWELFYHVLWNFGRYFLHYSNIQHAKKTFPTYISLLVSVLWYICTYFEYILPCHD